MYLRAVILNNKQKAAKKFNSFPYEKWKFNSVACFNTNISRFYFVSNTVG